VTLGDHSFLFAATHAWNTLPDFVMAVPAIATFCAALKTYLFSDTDNTSHFDFVTCS